ncbi:MAG: helix-turn-helix domain-containing protein [Treponema sp.]|nr:helix-turn-helix domain-containing protein [Treponema sp.]
MIERMEKMLYPGFMLHKTGKDGEDFLHYIPYSPEDERLGMLVTTAGSVVTRPYTVYPPRKQEHPALFRSVAQGRILPEFQIVYITQGEGSFTLCEADTTYKANPGALFLMPPGVKHQYKPDFETGWHEYWVGFKGDYFDRLAAEQFLSPDHVFFEVGLHDHIITLFNHIFDEVKAQRPLFQFKTCTFILELLSEVLSRERRREQPGYYQKIIEKAKYLMESNIYGMINLSYMAATIGISVSCLIKIFKTYTAMTPYQYFMQIKIHKAQHLLEQNDATITAIADRMGFEDPYYFSRLFKKKTGFTPSAWRKLVHAQSFDS